MLHIDPLIYIGCQLHWLGTAVATFGACFHLTLLQDWAAIFGDLLGGADVPKGTPSALRRVTQARFTLIFVICFSQSISQCMSVCTCLVSLNLGGPCGVRAGTCLAGWVSTTGYWDQRCMPFSSITWKPFCTWPLAYSSTFFFGDWHVIGDQHSTIPTQVMCHFLRSIRKHSPSASVSKASFSEPM